MTLRIKRLVRDNDLLNDEDLESYHKETWHYAKAKDFHIDKNADLSDIIIKKENGKFIIVDGRHRIRALYNDGIKKVRVNYVTD